MHESHKAACRLLICVDTSRLCHGDVWMLQNRASTEQGVGRGILDTVAQNEPCRQYLGLIVIYEPR